MSRPHSYPRSKSESELDEIFAECTHSDIASNENGFNICADCGMEMDSGISHDQEWRFYGDVDNKHSSDPSRVQYKKNPDKGIRKDLEKLNLPVEVINIADDYYFQVTQGEIKRSNLRKGIMYACVFEAYKDLRQPQTPCALQVVFNNISRKNISKGLTYFHLRYKEKGAKTEHITAEHFIPTVLKKFSVTDEHINIVLDLYRKIEGKSSILNRSNPQSVSCGLVYYYFTKNKIDINSAKFGKIVNLSDITVTKIASEIEEIMFKMNKDAPARIQ
jgi:transcription initiation factor TFIIIB Brf1 subunit/transcription initiation factor TFIIB